MNNFERELVLDDLLAPRHQVRLVELLATLAEANVSLIEGEGGAGDPLEFNLDTLGRLETALSPSRHRAAVQLFELVLFYAGKYHLAANLHLDVTEASHAELQRKHDALKASEARYKQLSKELQQRVEEQVKVIEAAQQQLYESARLRAVGQLAAGIAHEINTPVGFIGTNMRVAADYLDELEAALHVDEQTAALLEDFRALLAESGSGAQRIAGIVSDLRIFSNIDQAEFAACDLNALLTTTCHLIQAEHQHELAIELMLADIPPVAGYPAKLSQVFYNIFDNAAKALGEGGSIRVTSRSRDDIAEIVIEDDGCGMEPDVLARVYEPFFTTRGVGAGTGLGLSVVRDVMAAHEGEVSVQSQPDQGTAVTLSFRIN